MSERQALDAAIKRAVSSAPFVRSISAALAGVLTPEEGTCVLPPLCQQSRQFRYDHPRYGMRYTIHDGAGFEINVHKCSHESCLGKWLGDERRVDGEGLVWERSFGFMVIDDFGNLVEAE